MSATQTPPTWALPLTYYLEVEAQTGSESEGAVNSWEGDVWLWQLDEDGWD